MVHASEPERHHMENQFRLYQRSGVCYAEDTTTGIDCFPDPRRDGQEHAGQPFECRARRVSDLREGQSQMDEM